ncbi:hypothetical protein GGP41_002203 [Bipolaris sorokiniana]|uniref:Uncharacterized protein n=1 Tax=Cochliobolus sativus TaxID=45130 RepID=A0A8H5ZTH3_COCSA|nr:hypothetical protein GGP41_002203 [Bipolaris sorokiniana]
MLHHIHHIAPDIQLLVHLYIRHFFEHSVICLLCGIAIKIATRLVFRRACLERCTAVLAEREVCDLGGLGVGRRMNVQMKKLASTMPPTQ